MFLKSGLMMAKKTRLIASGVSGGSSIPVSSSGADIGDLIVVWQGFGGNLALSGSGWTTHDFPYSSGGDYTSRVMSKILTAKSDITVTNGSNGFGWSIFRGVRTAAVVAEAYNTDSVTWPATAASCSAQLLLAHRQTNSATTPTPPSGFSLFASGKPGLFFHALMLRLTGLTAGAKTISAWSAAGGDSTQYLQAIELRR